MENEMNLFGVPDVPFQMLTSLPLTPAHWVEIARHAPWQMTRMNLNTFARHGVFKDETLVRTVADRLRNPEAIRRAKVFPYQLMAAYMNVGSEIPAAVTEALQDAMEVAISNVPKFSDAGVAVCVDVSGSMSSRVTGNRGSASSTMTCVDVAALMAACVLRTNPHAVIVPFECKVRQLHLNPRDTVLTNAQKLAGLCGGGTNCSCALNYLNKRKFQGDVVIYVSDNESWMDTINSSETATMTQWEVFRERNPHAKLVNIDIQPYRTTQTPDRPEIANIGGFSDTVFDFIADFVKNDDPAHWVDEIGTIPL